MGAVRLVRAGGVGGDISPAVEQVGCHRAMRRFFTDAAAAEVGGRGCDIPSVRTPGFRRVRDGLVTSAAMPLYELSIDPASIRQAERLVTLEGRGYPTLAMHWESRIFDQPWTVTVVLDYLIALPPLVTGQATFNEVRIAAYVGGASTKFLYFGTEMTKDVARIGPEMENTVGPAGDYQEFRLEERTCPMPYLKLIQATPRIFGNGSQDYYSPPIKVERYDGTVAPAQLADFFPSIVANRPAVAGDVLTDAARGHWSGARFVGPSAIAISRQGKLVGLCRRASKESPKEGLPTEIVKRDPKLDVLRRWVAIDFGARSTVVACGGDKGTPELLRIGGDGPVTRSSDLESPSEVYLHHVGRTVKAWRDRVIQPQTRWEDASVGHAARSARLPAPPAPTPGGSSPPPPVTGPDPQRSAPAVTELSWLRERMERKETLKLRGATDPDANETLKKPAPPVIDEDGVGAHDPFNPVELYAYQVGMHVNERSRGIVTRYLVALPTGWPSARRESVVVAFRRGLFRSLPAGLVPFDDLDALRVIDAGPSAIAVAAHALRAFGIQSRGEPVPVCAIDAGASETGVVCGLLRPATPAEKEAGHERVIEHLEPAAVPWLGGERLLHRLAARVWSSHAALARELAIPIEPPIDEAAPEGAAESPALLASTLEARTNTRLLRDALRPVLEADATTKVPATLRLLSVEGARVDLPLTIERDALAAVVRQWLEEGAAAIKQAIDAALSKIGRQPDPYEGLHVVLGGRLGLSAALGDALRRELPASAKLHRYVEPDRTNPGAPTAKTACALGALSMRLEKLGAVPRAEARAAFGHRVGRARHGQLADVLDPTVDYDAWREMGACSKPEVEVLFMNAEDDAEVAADDPRMLRATCALGPDAVGKRVYLRAVGPTRVEVSVGAPGGDPDADAPCWAIDLTTGAAGPKGG